MIVVGSKVRLKGRPIKGVSFKVISIDKYGIATIKHSLSSIHYLEEIYNLELINK